MKTKMFLGLVAVVVCSFMVLAESKIIFSENFDGKLDKKLKTDKYGDVASDEGSKRLYITPSDSNDAKVIYNGDIPAADYSVSLKMKFVDPTSDRSFRIVLRGDEKWKNCILVSIKDSGSVTIGLKADGTSNGQPSKSAKITVDNKYHMVKATVKGSTTEFYYDGKKVLDFDDKTFPDAGTTGLLVDKKSGAVYVDDFGITTP